MDSIDSFMHRSSKISAFNGPNRRRCTKNRESPSNNSISASFPTVTLGPRWFSSTRIGATRVNDWNRCGRRLSTNSNALILVLRQSTTFFKYDWIGLRLGTSGYRLLPDDLSYWPIDNDL